MLNNYNWQTNISEMAQESTTKWLICRICLKNENKKLYNIFEPVGEDALEDLGTILLDKIELCGAIKLSQQSNLPNKICNRCVLLLRAAYKFRDLCQQSQTQLKQFMANIVQKEETNETVEKHDSGTNAQKIEMQSEVGDEQLRNDDYVLEERVMEYDDAPYGTEQSIDSKNSDYINVAEEVIEIQELSGFENSEDIVEEIGLKEYANDENDDEPTLKYERYYNEETTFFEEVTKQTERPTFKKRITEKKSASKRKRSQCQGDAFNTVYNCTLCDNTYTDKTKYNNHMKIHAKDKPHECEICKKRFSTTPQLSRHMNSHTGNRPYKCQYCVASFGDPSTKIKHERIHTNERPYKCFVCKKAFAYSNVLKVHMMTHTGEKPHTCEYCGKSFSQIHHKNAHEKRHAFANMVVVQNSPDDEYMQEDEEEDLKGYTIEEII